MQKRLFDEDELTASKAERIIVNQEISSDRTRYLKDDDDKRGNSRTSVVARLGNRVDRSRVRFDHRNRNRSRSYSPDRSFSRDNGRNRRFEDKHDSNYNKASFLCSYCKKRGHTRRFCYKLNGKSPRKDRNNVNFISSPKPSTDGLFKRLKTHLEGGR